MEPLGFRQLRKCSRSRKSGSREVDPDNDQYSLTGHYAVWRPVNLLVGRALRIPGQSALSALAFPAKESVHGTVVNSRRKDRVHGPSRGSSDRGVAALERRCFEDQIPRCFWGGIEVLEQTVPVSTHRLAASGEGRRGPERARTPPSVRNRQRRRSSHPRPQGIFAGECREQFTVEHRSLATPAGLAVAGTGVADWIAFLLGEDLC